MFITPYSLSNNCDAVGTICDCTQNLPQTRSPAKLRNCFLTNKKACSKPARLRESGFSIVSTRKLLARREEIVIGYKELAAIA